MESNASLYLAYLLAESSIILISSKIDFYNFCKMEFTCI